MVKLLVDRSGAEPAVPPTILLRSAARRLARTCCFSRSLASIPSRKDRSSVDSLGLVLLMVLLIFLLLLLLLVLLLLFPPLPMTMARTGSLLLLLLLDGRPFTTVRPLLLPMLRPLLLLALLVVVASF